MWMCSFGHPTVHTTCHAASDVRPSLPVIVVPAPVRVAAAPVVEVRGLRAVVTPARAFAVHPIPVVIVVRASVPIHGLGVRDVRRRYDADVILLRVSRGGGE